MTTQGTLTFQHEMTRTWDNGNPEAVDGWVTWCAGCGQRPWPCDTVKARAALLVEIRDEVEQERDALLRAVTPSDIPCRQALDWVLAILDRLAVDRQEGET